MKTIEEFQNFYETTLVSELADLEKERKIFIGKLLKTTFVFAGIAAAVFVMFRIFYSPIAVFVQNKMLTPTKTFDSSVNVELIQTMTILQWCLVGAVVIIWLVVFLIRLNKFTKQFTHDFKQEVIKKIVSFIDGSLYFSPAGFISSSEFLSSKILTHRIDRYKGEDLVSGTVGATSIRFSEIHAEYKTETTDSKGRTRTHWHTIFKGLFFIADFNKYFKTRTVVLPDTLEKMFGFLGKTLQSWNVGRDELIKLEDPEFEKYFCVYGQEQVESRYILSTSLMKRIVDFKKKTRKNISLSFVNSNVYVSIPVNKDLFEPKIFSSVMKFELIREYFEYLILTIGIVEDLNLNTRIWTKQ